MSWMRVSDYSTYSFESLISGNREQFNPPHPQNLLGVQIQSNLSLWTPLQYGQFTMSRRDVQTLPVPLKYGHLPYRKRALIENASLLLLYIIISAEFLLFKMLKKQGILVHGIKINWFVALFFFQKVENEPSQSALWAISCNNLKFL